MLRFLAAALLLLVSLAAPAQTLPRLDLQFEKLEEALNLTPAQKDQYDLAVGATKRMLMQLALAGLQLKQRLAEELGKPRPDIDIAREIRNAFDEGRTLRIEARDEWRKLLAMLDRDQVATLRGFVQQHLDHLGLLHEFLLREALPR